MIRGTYNKSQISGYRKVATHFDLKLINNKQRFVFKDASYLVCRPIEKKCEFGVYFVFYSNLKSAKHKHADDLSIFLQEGLSPWLVDGRAFNKEVSDKL